MIIALLETFKEDWETWDQIEDWQILKSDTFLNFALPESFVYLAPRFMLFVLDGKIKGEK